MSDVGVVALGLVRLGVDVIVGDGVVLGGFVVVHGGGDGTTGDGDGDGHCVSVMRM